MSFFLADNDFQLSAYEIWKLFVSLVEKNLIFIANFNDLGLLIPKIQNKSEKKFRLSRGVVVRALNEIYIDDISAVLRATDLGFHLPFIMWAGLMHLILRI
jgi:hypothetical protein